MTSQLAWEAQYGRLPFDRFVLDNWNESLPESQAESQWTSLTKRWLDLDPSERMIYWEEDPELGCDASIPRQERIEEILKLFQTPHERNLILPDVIWLRTCYTSDLEHAYQEIFDRHQSVVDDWKILDHPAIYNFGTSWHHILERLPTLCDRKLASDIPDDFLKYQPAEDHRSFELWDAGHRAVVMLYLLDKQAILEGMVTILWLDCHGECVWWYRISPDLILEFTVCIESTDFLKELVSEGVNESDAEKQIFTKGAIIDYMFT